MTRLHTPEDFRRFARAKGVPVVPGQVTVMALRRGPDQRVTSQRYEDQFVVFKTNGAVEVFRASTRPAQKQGPGQPDKNRDGKPDLGMLRPGNYEAHGDRGRTFGWQLGINRQAFRVASPGSYDQAKAWYDVNGDGFFSEDEKRASERRGDMMKYARIHVGFEESGTRVNTGKTLYGTWSVGCPNVPLSEIDRFSAAVGGSDASFVYSIVDAD